MTCYDTCNSRLDSRLTHSKMNGELNLLPLVRFATIPPNIGLTS